MLPTTIGESGGVLTATYTAMAVSGTSTLQFQAVLKGTVTPAQVITNTGVITWTSLPGAPAVSPQTTRTPTNALAS